LRVLWKVSMCANTLLGLGAQDEGDGVDPVGADVADRAEFAAFAGEDAPVVVGLLDEPVLEEMTLHVHDPAEVAARTIARICRTAGKKRHM
jgi:hypothetical protein